MLVSHWVTVAAKKGHKNANKDHEKKDDQRHCLTGTSSTYTTILTTSTIKVLYK